MKRDSFCLKGVAQILGLFLFSWLFVFGASAASIDNMPQMPVVNDYVVGPGKVELLASPGQTIIKNITVTNRFGREKNFQLELEDFKGSKQGGVVLELLGPLKGPYSLKDFLKPEVSDFTLQHGERITIPVSITIPQDSVPGGLYGSVIVTAKEDPTDPDFDDQDASGNIKTTSRIAVLFFVRIKGEVRESGLLKDFKSDSFYYSKPPINFFLSYENTGSVYSNPYGEIEIRNAYGSTIENIRISPFYVLPDSIRTNQIKWSGKKVLFGYYKAKLKIYHGFEDAISEKEVGFLVIPWKLLGGAVLFLAVFVLVMNFIIKWIRNNVEIKRKK